MKDIRVYRCADLASHHYLGVVTLSTAYLCKQKQPVCKRWPVDKLTDKDGESSERRRQFALELADTNTTHQASIINLYQRQQTRYLENHPETIKTMDLIMRLIEARQEARLGRRVNEQLHLDKEIKREARRDKREFCKKLAMEG